MNNNVNCRCATLIPVLVKEANSILSQCLHRHVQSHGEDLIKAISILTNLSQQDSLDSISTNIASAYNTFGNIKFAMNDFEAASSFYEKAFRMRRRVLGKKHLDTCITAFNLGKSLHSHRKPDRALLYYEIFANTIFTSPELVNKTTIMMLQKIAWAFHQDRSLKHAKKFYGLALKSAFKVLGDRDENVARILNMYGNLWFEIGRMDRALKCYERSLVVERPQFDDLQIKSSARYLNILTTISNIAATYENMGNLKKSLLCFKKMLTILNSDDSKATVSTSKINTRVAMVLSDMARVHGKLGQYDIALKTLSEVLEIRRKEYGNQHGLIASVLNEIGIIHGSQGHTNNALQNFEESLTIRRILNDPESNVSTVLCNIARVHMVMGDTDKALARFKQSAEHELSKREGNESSTCDESSTDVLFDSLEQTARILEEDFNDPQEALKWYNKGIDTIAKEGPDVVPFEVHSRLLGLAGNLYLKLGDSKKAISLFTQTMRVNVAGGLAFNANIRTTGYETHQVEGDHRPAAAAA